MMAEVKFRRETTTFVGVGAAAVRRRSNRCVNEVTGARRVEPQRRRHAVLCAVENSNLTNTKGDGDDGLPRKLLAGLSVVGLLETAFLTYKKLFGGGVGSLCTTAGCLEVLGGPYSTVFGLPLTLFGMGGYAAVLALCVYPLLTSNQKDAETRDRRARTLLVTIGTAMGTFSAYLMFVLFGVIRGWCPWCLVSAGISETIAFIVLSRTLSSSWRNSLFTALVTTLASVSVFVTTPGGVFDASVIRDPPVVTEISSGEALDIAEGLQKKDTRMFGAYWCSHCYGQKQLLGKEAMKKIQYVECSDRGRNSQAQLCREKKLPGYPAWEIDGKLYFGEQTFDDFREIITTGQKANDPYADLLEDLKD
eukprot:Plantae.Rhodophyta-Purpureofilum_apyrenoidigerum.ctg21272.p1 GENE.Plantae.Rhodophyta-Purpureofilum_apyrenoidigerum.ctg21272~~Plantae.Rhodophyta-Purpureofilum_apyrenoidigerum.ctg21272.p1  ORF type:complete len:363 (+),score=63.69 Plantae.Rhodophyta-Purpureofilum_apyrenoidigerum.ctg21272:160-1248(+)